MTAQDYIISTVQVLAQPMPMEDLGGRPLEDAICAKVMSKKFRKLKADNEAIAITKKAIKLAIKDDQPVTVSILFGGNKLWRFEEAPEIDWAELFSTTYFIHWMKSIASVYEPGAHLDFYSQDISVESLNNIPRLETDKYSETFKAMLEWLKPYIPNNVIVTYRRHADEYSDPVEYLKELEEAKVIILAENKGKLPKMDETQKAATELNVKLRPGQADDPEWREKVELQHQAIFRTKSLLPYLEDPHLIPACPSPYPGLIATGSTKASIAKFWAGIGALKTNGDSFVELVLTPKQLQVTTFNWENIHIDGLEGKNFNKIRVLTDS